MGHASSPRTRLERWTLARAATRRQRVRLVIGASLAAALVSVAICALVYRLTGLTPTTPVEAAISYGLPVLLPLVIAPLVLGHLIRLAATLTERSAELEEEVRRRQRVEAKLAILVTTDDLTQLANRRAFFARAAEIANGSAETATVAVLDLDNFKRLNDTQGHAAGDDALRAGGALMRAHIDARGVVARLGGEEFGVILPGTAPEEAWAILDDLRTAFAELGGGISVSIGASEWVLPVESIDTALGRADSALYLAKQRGRNRVEIASLMGGDVAFGTELAPVARREHT